MVKKKSVVEDMDGDVSERGVKKGDKAYVPRLKLRYYQEIVAELVKRRGYKNALQVPQFEKVVINIGLGKAVSDSKLLQAAMADLALIAGQKPVMTRAKKSIATFKLRKGMPIGAKVTLRGNRMYDFLDHLVSFVLFRIRDFRGLSTKSFDGRGNYALGIKEHFIFPTVNYDKATQDIGMDIVFTTKNAKTDEEAFPLFSLAGFPFRKHG